MEDIPISDYENELYKQLEESKVKLKFWQDRYLDVEQKLGIITTKYNAVCIENQRLKISGKKI